MKMYLELHALCYFENMPFLCVLRGSVVISILISEPITITHTSTRTKNRIIVLQ